MNIFDLRQSISNNAIPPLKHEELLEYLKSYKLGILIKNNNRIEIQQSEINQILENAEFAQEQIINSITFFILKICDQYKTNNVSLEDLFQSATTGIISNLDKFDPSKGSILKFAEIYSKKYILQYIYEIQNIIEIPRVVKDNLRIINKAKTKFILNNHRDPTILELIELTALSEKKIIRSLNYQQANNIKSLYDFDEDDNISEEYSEFNLDSVFSIENEIIFSEEEHIINNMLSNEIQSIIEDNLSELENSIIKKLYIDPDIGVKTKLIDIANELQISVNTLKKYRDQALNKIRDHL